MFASLFTTFKRVAIIVRRSNVAASFFRGFIIRFFFKRRWTVNIGIRLRDMGIAGTDGLILFNAGIARITT
jgi:hypothetical protein